nr:anthranilate synthase component I family protein [Microbacterium endophyticum]
MPSTIAELGPECSPERVFCAVAAEHNEVFWIDAGYGASSGWSWIGTGHVVPATSPLAVLIAQQRPSTDSTLPPGPTPGSWVGWTAYETGASAAGAPTSRDETVDLASWLVVERVVAFDHSRAQAWAAGPDAEAWSRELAEATPEPPSELTPDFVTARARDTPAEYAALIEQAREAIREGDAYQLCVTTRFTVEREVDDVAAYLRHRRASASPHGGFFRTGDTALLSASPELFLAASGGVIRTRPIKGTRPRGDSLERDRALQTELKNDPKEQAENVMIVDLMRNDLSQVSRKNSVAVTQLREIESYPHVHQLVSTVESEVADGATFGDLLHATFPAGSMTGAPKLSAMTILNRLERMPRGIFSGCFGWVHPGGVVELGMVIRSIVVTAHSATVSAGGGITWMSVADAEVAEVGIKARAPLAAIGAKLPTGW